MKKIIPLSLCSIILSGHVLASDNVSQYWTNYINSRQDGSTLLDPSFKLKEGFIPPDFSYAGYQHGDQTIPTLNDLTNYKTFNVLDFGAIANDEISDKDAFKKAAMAISEYSKNHDSYAVLYIPEGVFIVNDQSDMDKIDSENKTDLNTNQTIKIFGSNIIVQGAGAGKTVLLMKEPLLPTNPKQKWSTPYLFEIGQTKSAFYTDGAVSKVSDDIVSDSTFDLPVLDSSLFKAGDYIEVKAIILDKKKINDAVKPYKLELNKKGKPFWKNLTAGLHKIEKHQIESVKDGVLTLTTPIIHNIDAQDNWSVSKINPATGVGVQNLTFKGSWSGDFVHHASALADSGYSMGKLSRTTDSWIKNVHIEDYNQAFQVIHSFNNTVEDVIMSGNPGHIAISVLYGNNNLLRRLQDNAHTWHAPGLSKYSSHNVFINNTHSPKMGLDLHGNQSVDNLFDNIKGGWVPGHWGGAVGNQPNHLSGLYFWNNENTGKESDKLEFMSGDGRYKKMMPPHLIGLHGNELKVVPQFNYMIKAKQKGWADYKKLPKRNVPQAYIESQGKPVFPSSLYYAQLELRKANNK